MNQVIHPKIKEFYFLVVKPLVSIKRLNLILLVIAVLFLIGMIRQVGVDNLGQYFRQVGHYGWLLFIPYGVMNLLTAIAWKLLLVDPGGSPSLARLFLLRLAGESLNQLTPTASLGGEPFKAFRLHASGVQWQQSTASLVIHKGLMVMSLVLYILVSLILVPFVLPIKGIHLVILCFLTLILALAGGSFVALQHRNPCGMVIKVLEKWGVCPAFLKTRQADLAVLDATMAQFYRRFPGRGAAAFWLLFLGWIVQAAEVYLIFWMLGHPIGWTMAFCIDALSMLFTGLGFMIPAQLGIQDGGNILLTVGLQLGVIIGVAFSIMRRIREAAWLLLGLVVVAYER